jgi:hypothetical protein
MHSRYESRFLRPSYGQVRGTGLGSRGVGGQRPSQRTLFVLGLILLAAAVLLVLVAAPAARVDAPDRIVATALPVPTASEVAGEETLPLASADPGAPLRISGGGVMNLPQ